MYKKICNILDEFDEQVILVGHSMGGIVISQVAEERPQKIKKLVYLTAYLLQDGESIIQAFQEDKDSLLRNYIAMSDDGSLFTLKEEGLNVLYPDVSDEDIERIKKFNKPQPALLSATPVNLSEENYGSISRIYIECKNDHAITPTVQKDMYTKMPCDKVLTLETSHAPNYAAPEKVVECLLNC